jgi:hypothetical protein
MEASGSGVERHGAEERAGDGGRGGEVDDLPLERRIVASETFRDVFRDGKILCRNKHMEGGAREPQTSRVAQKKQGERRQTHR